MDRRAALMSTITSKGVANHVIQDDWDEIVTICKAGLASQFYSLGDYKPLPLTVPKTCTVNMELVGFKIDHQPVGSDLIAIETTWLSKELFEKASMPSWEYLNSTFYNALPTALKNGIVSARRFYATSASVGADNCDRVVTRISKATYRIWIPTVHNLLYDYGPLTSGPSARIKKLVGTSTSAEYALADRIPTDYTNPDSSYYIASVSTEGKFSTRGANASSHCSFTFSI